MYGKQSWDEKKIETGEMMVYESSDYAGNDSYQS